MKLLAVLLTVAACSSAALITPYAGYGGWPYGGLGYSGLGYSGLGYSGLGYSGLGHHGYGGLPLAYSGLGHLGGAPLVRTVAAAAPVIHAAAPAVHKSQYHAQDEIGQASYGHHEPLQTHNAVQDAHGNKVGSFSYLNPHDGQVHRTDYVADALGYRVAANDLPVAPVADLASPLPVGETPEVVAARVAHLAAHAEAASRTKRSVLLTTPAATAPLAYAASPLAYHHGYAASPLAYHSPLSYHHGYAASPLAYHAAAPVAAPAAFVRDATLTRIVNTPGHAISYRVD